MAPLTQGWFSYIPALQTERASLADGPRHGEDDNGVVLATESASDLHLR